jgi:hypothetical protein
MAGGAGREECVFESTRQYEQDVCMGIEKNGEFGTSPQCPASGIRAVITEKYTFEHRSVIRLPIRFDLI